ncbi:MAG: hypothetical protein ABSF61_01725 [Anaerolineales bacterium]|jgi:hypothetical protein
MIWLEPYTSIYDETLSGSGPLWFFLGLPSLLVWAVHNIVRRRWEETLITLLVLLGYAATPAFWVPRYGTPIVLLGALALAWIFGRLKQGVQRVLCAEVLMGACFVIFLTMDLGRVDPRVLRLHGLENRLHAIERRIRRGGARRPALRGRRDPHKPGSDHVQRLVQFVYPLYGPDFRNTVVYIPPTNELEWQRLLDQERIGLVITVKSKPQYTWISDDPEFVRVSSHGGYYVFARK